MLLKALAHAVPGDFTTALVLNPQHGGCALCVPPNATLMTLPEIPQFWVKTMPIDRGAFTVHTKSFCSWDCKFSTISERALNVCLLFCPTSERLYYQHWLL